MASRLLFDENLSPRLATVCADLFPGSQHVRDLGLKGATDQTIWAYAAEQGFCIVSKDDDFRGLSLLKGAPPKVIWLIVGNTSTAEITRILREAAPFVQDFLVDSATALLTLRRGGEMARLGLRNE